MGWGLYLAFVCALAATGRGEGAFDEVVDFPTPKTDSQPLMTRKRRPKSSEENDAIAPLEASNKVEVVFVKS